MYIPQVQLIPTLVNSLTLLKTDLPVPSNFTEVISYCGQQDWIGLWVDCPNRLTVCDGISTRTTLQLGWHTYLKYPQIKDKINWLKKRGYRLLPSSMSYSEKIATPTHVLLYHQPSQVLYLCPFVDIHYFLNTQTNSEKSAFKLDTPEQEQKWIEQFQKLTHQQSTRLQNYKISYMKIVKQMLHWLDSHFLDVSDSKLESIA